MKEDIETAQAEGSLEEQLEALARECDTGDERALSHRWVAAQIRKIVRTHKKASV